MQLRLKVNVEPPRLAVTFGLKVLAEKVCHLLTGLVRIVNDDLGGFLRVLRNVGARIFCGMLGQAEFMLGSVFRLDGKGVCVPIEAGESALGSLQATLANMVDLLGGLFASLGSIVHNYFTTFP